ncbi:MAG: hypothetical protein U0838_11515 [Chloroflexota bacterium]
MAIDLPAGPSALPLIVTKLRAPGVGRAYLERPRLLERLDPLSGDLGVVALLSAPPGYGKSVAVSGWIRAQGVDAAWLSVDAADNDLARFVRYLVAAVGGVRPGFGGSTLALLATGASAGPEALGDTLAAELGMHETPLVIVLDDYHAVRDASIHGLVRRLLDRRPPWVGLALLTREDPPLPLARLRAHGRLIELRAEDLRLTADEAAVYLAGALESPLDSEDLTRLLARTEGWPAGLQLAALALAGRADRRAALDAFQGSHRYVLDYLADEVLDRVDVETAAFLSEVSLLSRFTADLCGEVTGRADAAELLARAEIGNLFLVPLDDERRWFRFHHLFGEYLQGRLERAQVQGLHARAAAVLMRAGHVEEAVDHALASGDPALAGGTVAGAIRPAFDAGELTTVLRWLDALPMPVAEAGPVTASIGAWTLFLTGRVTEAGAVAVRALERLPDAERDSADAGRLLAAHALVIGLTTGDFAAAEPPSRRALELLSGDPLFRAFALLTLGEVALTTDALVEGEARLADAWRLARPTGQPTAIIPILYLWSVALIALGRRDRAEAACREVLAQFDAARPRRLPIVGLARIALGNCRGQRDGAARRELEEGFRDAMALEFRRFLLGQGAAVLAKVRGDRVARTR